VLGLGLGVSGVYLSVSSTMKHRAEFLEGAWQEYTPALLAEIRDRGEVAFIDFTADWCINCKFLEATVLDREPVHSALRADGVVMLRVDLSGSNPDGSKLLRELGRVGIPTWAVVGPGLDHAVAMTDYTPGGVVGALQEARGAP